ncbi:hypothetical protein [Effusibacillus consociatus]|uniref:Homing endonuclease LAGLIDADG domain-containing protein n=1 Tax=Effusibacillus consociatus TaxID=1117041 RepID=A0ABV9PYD5_9BACL
MNSLLDYKVFLEAYPLSYETPKGKTKTLTITNGPKGILRKLSSLRTLYGYLFKADLISKNITEKLGLPKIHHRIKKPLSIHDTCKVIDVIYNGEKYFTDKHLSGYTRKKLRDIAIFTTLLGTGSAYPSWWD